MAGKDNNSQKISKGMLARILILFLTAFIGLGFIYTMLYKGIVYETLFSKDGYFGKFEETSGSSAKTSSTPVSTTPKPEKTPENTEQVTSEPTPGETTMTPEPTATPEPSPSFEPIQKGMDDSVDGKSRVRELQTLLAKKGYLSYEYITGYFGNLTETAVKKFQKDNDLPQTGIVDETTMEKIKAAKDVM